MNSENIRQSKFLAIDAAEHSISGPYHEKEQEALNEHNISIAIFAKKAGLNSTKMSYQNYNF